MKKQDDSKPPMTMREAMYVYRDAPPDPAPPPPRITSGLNWFEKLCVLAILVSIAWAAVSSNTEQVIVAFSIAIAAIGALAVELLIQAILH